MSPRPSLLPTPSSRLTKSLRRYTATAIVQPSAPIVATMLEFLYPSFGFFSRTLPAESAPLPNRLRNHRKWNSSRILGTSLSRIRLEWSRCVCGRTSSSCMRCRASSSSSKAAGEERKKEEEGNSILGPSLADGVDPAIPPAEPPIRIQSKAAKSAAAKVDLSALTKIIQVLDKQLPSIRTTSLPRRVLPPIPKSPLARRLRPGRSTTWTLDSAEGAANELWNRTQSFRSSSSTALPDVQQLDFIRLFGRFVRAVPAHSSLLPTSGESHLLEVETYMNRLARFRETQGKRMAQLLDTLPIGRGNSHWRSLATLYIDSLCLGDSLPGIPPPSASSSLFSSTPTQIPTPAPTPAPVASPNLVAPSLALSFGAPVVKSTPIANPTPVVLPNSAPFLADALRLIFSTAEDDAADSARANSRKQGQLTTLSLLLEYFKRATNGGEQALRLVYGWDITSLFLPSEKSSEEARTTYDAAEGYKSLLRRSYGELLGQLQPTPSRWFNTALDTATITEPKSIALHLIHALSFTGSPIEALSIWQTLRSLEIVLMPKDEIAATGHLLEGLFRGGFFEDANRLVNDITLLVGIAYRQRASPDSLQPLRIEAIRTALQVAAQRGNVDRVDNWVAILRQTGWDDGLEGPARQLRARSQQNELNDAMRIFSQVNLLTASKEDRIKLWGELIRAQVRLDDVEGGMESLETLITQNLTPTVALINTLLHGYAARIDLSRTYALFNRIVSFNLSPDLVSYNALVTLHGNLRDPESAVRSMNEMRLIGIDPDIRIWTTLMNAYVEAGVWERAIEIYQYLDTHDDILMRPDIAAVNTLLKANILVATPAQSILAIFRQTIAKGLRPNVQTYTLVMQSLCSAGLMELAEDLFTMMDHPNDQASPLPASTTVVQPDGFIFSILLQGYLHLGDTRRARACLLEMKARGIQPSSITYGIIVGSYLKRNTTAAMNSAKSLAKDFVVSSPLAAQRHKQPTQNDRPFARGQDLLNVFGPIINAYAKRMEAKLAMEYFSQVLHEDVQPSIPLYTSLMDAYRGAVQLDSVKYLWNHLHQLVLDTYPDTSPLPPRAIQFPPIDDPALRRIDSNHRNLLCLPLSVYISALTDTNAHAEISSIWQQLSEEGFAFDAGNWNSLAVALVEDGQLERAFWISEYVLCEVAGGEQDVRSTEGTRVDRSGGLLIDTTLRTPNRIHQKRDLEGMIQRKERAAFGNLIAPRFKREGEEEINMMTQLIDSRTTRRSHYWFPHSRLLSAFEEALYKLSRAGGGIISRGKWKAHESELAQKFEMSLGQEEGDEMERKLRRDHPKTMIAMSNATRARQRREENLER